jgi:hypothetical protein
MDEGARHALETLLSAADRSAAGVRVRVPALTESHLVQYRQLRSLDAKESFEATMKDARVRGAIDLMWDDHARNGFIKRVNLLDIAKLASFLSRETAASVAAAARLQLEPHLERYPVLAQVLQSWGKLKKVRGLGPGDVALWLDALAVVDFARANTEAERVDLPLRVASARLFKDSKRIERLHAPIDVLLLEAIDATPREPAEVWHELGLFREEQPARLAGNVIVRRERLADYLDVPYTGLSPTTVLGLGSKPSAVLSIENQTTFHVEARAGYDKEVLLIYSAGMPSPAWRKMYATLLRDVAVGTPILHWGDVDEGGFRIAANIGREATAAGHTLQPWKMSPDDVPEDRRRPAKASTLTRMAAHARAAGWTDLAERITSAGFTVEQESLV